MLLKVDAIVVLPWSLLLTEVFTAAQSISNEVITTKTQIFQNVGNANPLTLITTEVIPAPPSLPPYIVVTATIMTPGPSVTHTVTETMPEITKTMTVSLATVTTTGLCFISGENILTPCTTAFLPAASSNSTAQSAAIPRMNNPFRPFVSGISIIKTSIESSIQKTTDKYYELYLALGQPGDSFSTFPITKRDDNHSTACTMAILSKKSTVLLLCGSLVLPTAFSVLVIYYLLTARKRIDGITVRAFSGIVFSLYFLAVISIAVIMVQLVNTWLLCQPIET
ncbi:hypothetical protein B0J14DRAFT_558139 [Halenospora varia]|nr:hypothetical protein B0J14DRAFT_558139 [Halenospora varia]